MLKFEIKLENEDLETWMDEVNIQDQIESLIKTKMINQIMRLMDSEWQKKLEQVVTQEFAKHQKEVFSRYCKDSFESGAIKISGLHINEHLDHVINKERGWNQVKNSFEKIAGKYVTDLKARYDLKFASHVVAKMAENNLLKDEDLKKLI